MINSCFALLDDCSPGHAGSLVAAAPAAGKPVPPAPGNTSRLYTELSHRMQCASAAGLPALLEQMQAALRAGLHALALLHYELGEELHDIAPRADAGSQSDHSGGVAHGMRAGSTSNAPLAEILLFRQCARLTAGEVDAWLQAQVTSPATAGIANLRASIDEASFARALARIHAYIEAGDAYQINFTYRLDFDAYGDPLALYRKLRARQAVPYGALVALPDGRAVLSFSPELFVRHAAGVLTARPMKGTAPAGATEAIDRARAAALAADPKNRAENLMIVDLLRNDLGRIAVPGSVQAPQLFDVHRFGSVLQMTSTVTARMREDTSLHHAIAALYPCGSITGAPKRRAMQIIRELESTPRGLYTGAIGWFDAPAGDAGLGDFCLSVAIRTLQLDAPEAGAVRKGQLGVGAGIVYDSNAAEEFAECQLKAAFLTGAGSDFHLFETMHGTRKGVRHGQRHLQRLLASARYFHFPCDESSLAAAMQDACAALDEGPHRLRLALHADGTIEFANAPLQPLDLPARIFLSAQATDRGDLFLRHKSSLRALYDQAWREAETRGGFDTLFFNQHGHLTEGGRSNVFVHLDGEWLTPPLESGVLPGVMRGVLLEDPAWGAREALITRDDLRRASEVVVCNALRGVIPAQVVWDQAGISNLSQ